MFQALWVRSGIPPASGIEALVTVADRVEFHHIVRTTPVDNIHVV